MKYYISLLLTVTFLMTSWSQEYKEMIIKGTHTVQEIQAKAEVHFSKVGTERGKGYKPYKRWEYNALRNMDENGYLKSADFYYNELEKYNKARNVNTDVLARTTEGTWEQMGPTSWNATSGWNPGVGRITSIGIEAANTNHIIVGGASGGVWKTTNGGGDWTVLTDNMSNLIVASLTINPLDNTNYFWGSSQGNIFSSTDSGSTWSLLSDTGDGNVNKILIDPTNANKMYCSVQGGGIYKSLDAGVNWTLIHSWATNGFDVEFKPGNTNTVYATGNRFFKSTDGGVTFIPVTNSVLSNGPKMMGVSADNSNMVYVLEASNGIFGALYKSTDSGDTFVKLNHGTNNYFGYSSNADDGYGQAPRDMDIVVNPNDADDVHIAGILSWRSTNGGTSFSITSQWIPSSAASQNIGYCHADIDIMEYVNGKIYVGSDGGLFVAENPLNVNNNYYTDITSGLGIRQFYKIGVSQTAIEVVSGGSQDNGTSVYNDSGNWNDWLGADGMETFVDKNNNDIIYGTVQFGSLYKSTNQGLSSFGLSSPENKDGNWITPFEQDPIVQNTIYTGYDEVYKSINGGDSWTSISQNFSGNLDHLKIAPSNNNVMFAARSWARLYKTEDGGATNWVTLNGFSGNINSIAIHPTDPNKVAIATTGEQKVYVSTDGGTTWTSYLKNLPDFNALALVWSNHVQEGLYVGMNYGVYYIDTTDAQADWLPFSNNLPNVQIGELEINTANNKLYAGTFGRGLWKSDLYDVELSVDEHTALNTMTVFPNPATDSVNLSWDKNEDVSIRIYNTLGKLIYFTKSQDLTNGFEINTSNYESGMYFVNVNTLNGAITKKLMIE